MKLVVIGGSAQSTPNLFRTEAVQGISHSLDVVLSGRSPDTLEAVARMISLLPERPPRSVALVCARRVEDALVDADVVLVQARYGGLAARRYDETFPLAFGVCGDEGLGPAGFANAWRSWPPLRSLLQAVERAAPRTRVIVLTAPLGVLTRCARAAFPTLDVSGLCELPWVTLLGLPAAQTGSGLMLDYAGVNHLGWFYDRAGTTYPLPYLRLHEHPQLVLCEQRTRPPRADVLQALSDAALAAFRDGSAGAAVAALARRPTPWYEHAVAPLLAALADSRDAPETFFRTTENAGFLADLRDDDIVEAPFHYRGGTFVRRDNVTPPPELVTRAISAFVAAERHAARSVMMRDEGAMHAAIEAHPWVRDRRHVAGLVDAIVNQPAALVTS